MSSKFHEFEITVWWFDVQKLAEKRQFEQKEEVNTEKQNKQRLALTEVISKRVVETLLGLKGIGVDNLKHNNPTTSTIVSHVRTHRL